MNTVKKLLTLAAVCGVSLAAGPSPDPTMGAWTDVVSDCDENGWWRFSVEAATSVGGNPGVIYATGVSTEWSFGCNEAVGCVAEGLDEKEAPHTYVSIYHGYNGYISPIPEGMDGRADSNHWVEGESYSDSGDSSDTTGSFCVEHG